jgi:hypothetical protein
MKKGQEGGGKVNTYIKTLLEESINRIVGVWQGVAMDSIMYHSGLPYPILLHSAGGPPRNGLTAVSRVVCLKYGRPAAVFYPFGHPTLYAYEQNQTKGKTNI